MWHKNWFAPEIFKFIILYAIKINEDTKYVDPYGKEVDEHK